MVVHKNGSILIPFIIGLYKYKTFKGLRFLFLFVAFGVLSEIGTKVLKALEFKNTLVLAHSYVLISFVLLCLFYHNVFKTSVKSSWFTFLIVAFVLLCLLQLLFFQKVTDYPSIQFAALALVMIVFSLLYFHKVMLEAKLVILSNEPLIWINAAILIYYTGNFFYYILFNLFVDYSIEYLKTISIYFVALNALFYILIAVGFWKAGKQKARA